MKGLKLSSVQNSLEKRRNLLITGVVIVFVIILFPFLNHTFFKKEKQNVILISIDSLREDHMSMYGYKRATSSNLDTFAKKSFVAGNYFSTGFLTPISEASVHTGMYPQGNRVINFSSGIDSHTPTIAELLQIQGYRTGAFGGSPEFNENRFLGASFRRGFQVYNINKNVHNTLPDIGEILNWIALSNDPFFLWIPLGSVHFPYGAARDHFVDPVYKGVLKGDPLEYETVGYIYKNNIYSNRGSTLKPFLGKNKPNKINLGETDINYIVDKYDDGIYEIDQYLGQLLSSFEKNGLLKNSIIIIESEHGEDLGEHDYVMHYDIYDTTIHSPLIIFNPGTKGFFDKDSILSGVDIFPTILELLNIKTSIKTDGVSFANLLSGRNSKDTRHEIYASRTPLWERVRSVDDYDNADFVQLDNINHFHDYAIRNNKWKLIHRAARKAEEKYSWFTYISGIRVTRNEYELYDIQKDKNEKENVYNQNVNIKEIREMKEKLDNFEKISIERLKKISSQITVEPYFK